MGHRPKVRAAGQGSRARQSVVAAKVKGCSSATLIRPPLRSMPSSTRKISRRSPLDGRPSWWP
eukprot:8535802-Pyramimonas_sp.AAC.1